VNPARRKHRFHEAAKDFFQTALANRVLPFDRASADAYSSIASGLAAAGRGFDTADVQIAAIAKVHGFALATRNTRHFTDCGIELIDPFTPTAGR